MSPSNQKFPSDVDKLLPDICGLYSFLHLCDGCEELMDLVLVHRFEISVVSRPQDGVCDVFSDDLGDPLCDTFLDSNCCEAEDVLTFGFVLGVNVVCDLRFYGAVAGADNIGGRSQCRKLVSLLDVDR